jgi:hypothetical protein
MLSLATSIVDKLLALAAAVRQFIALSVAALGLIHHIREIGASTHPGKLDLLPLVQRLVEPRRLRNRA